MTSNILPSTYPYSPLEYDKILHSEPKRYHRIVTDTCPKCGSNLTISETTDIGVCTCKYCEKEVYVW